MHAKKCLLTQRPWCPWSWALSCLLSDKADNRLGGSLPDNFCILELRRLDLLHFTTKLFTITKQGLAIWRNIKWLIWSQLSLFCYILSKFYLEALGVLSPSAYILEKAMPKWQNIWVKWPFWTVRKTRLIFYFNSLSIVIKNNQFQL